MIVPGGLTHFLRKNSNEKSFCFNVFQYGSNFFSNVHDSYVTNLYELVRKRVLE